MSLRHLKHSNPAGIIAILDEDEQEAYEVLKKNKLIQQPIIEKHGGKAKLMLN